MTSLIKFLQKNIAIIIVILIAIIFAGGTSSFNYLTQSYSPEGDFVKWASPDETANYIFAKLYGQEGRIGFEEAYNRYTEDVMKPRSFRSDWGNLKPVSFLGIIIIFGKIVSLSSYKILPFLTPMFAGVGIIFFYLLVKRIWGKPNAFISALLLSVFPPYIYFSVRSMFHNILFTVFLIISLYFVILTIKKYQRSKKIKLIKKFPFIVSERSDRISHHMSPDSITLLPLRSRVASYLKETDWLGMLWSLLVGLFLGLAVMTRTSELLWLAPLFLLLWLMNFKKVGFTKLIVALVFTGLAILPMLYHNTLLYSSPILGGYSEMNNSIVAIKDAGTEVWQGQASGANFIQTLSQKIFHFGFDWKQSLKMLNFYYLEMFPIYWWLMLGGLILFILNFKTRKYKEWQWLLASGLVSIILVLYYGSWEFFDNPDKTAHTIGNSYTRYWLPMYLGAIPLASMFILALSRNLSEYWKKINTNCFRWALRIVAITIIGFFTISFVWSGSSEGLSRLYGQQVKAKIVQHRILELTQPNSTIITRYHDKLLFPERKVIVGLFDDQNMNAIYARLLNYLPVYYYNFTLPEKDLDYLNDRRLREAGMGIEEVEEVGDGFMLYRLYKIND